MGQIDRLRQSTEIANKALVLALVESIHKMAALKMPFLAWPVLKEFYKFLMTHSLGFLVEKGAIFFNIAWIKLEVSADAADLEEKRQKAIQLVKEGANEKELDEIDDQIKRAFDKLRRGGRGPL
jgi:hypothetical protein